MLKTRVFTALILVTAFLFALFGLPPYGWAAVAALIAGVAAWEWGGLLRWSDIARLVLGLATLLVCDVLALLLPLPLGLGEVFPLSAAWNFGAWFYLPAAAFWLLLVPLWMWRRWPLPGGVLGLAVGAVVILPTWLALLHLREGGAFFLLGIMALVWLADIAAYFSGRAFGKHKLAPSISPGKTWEGAIGAGVAVLIYGFLLADYLPAAVRETPLRLALVMIALTAVSVVGDLFESLLKRHAGLKDSSNILPGHGGVLDRIDSLTSTLPLVTLVWLAAQL